MGRAREYLFASYKPRRWQTHKSKLQRRWAAEDFDDARGNDKIHSRQPTCALPNGKKIWESPLAMIRDVGKLWLIGYL